MIIIYIYHCRIKHFAEPEADHSHRAQNYDFSPFGSAFGNHNADRLQIDASTLSEKKTYDGAPTYIDSPALVYANICLKSTKSY